MKTRFHVDAHIPHGSGDAEYRIVHMQSGEVVATIDPHGVFTDPSELAHRIADAMNLDPEAIL